MEFITYRLSLDSRKSGCQKTLQGFTNADKRARRLAVTINANGDTLELDKEHMAALMYVTRSNSTTPSVNACEIDGNTIIYKILNSDISVKGITKMQLKLIRGNIDDTPTVQNVIVSPSFQLEVLDTNTDDTTAQTTTTYTALEAAIAQAQAVYDHALYSIEFDEDLTFKAYYKDGTEYENDSFSILKDLADDLSAATSEAISEVQSDCAAASEAIRSTKASALSELAVSKSEAESYIASEKNVAVSEVKYYAESTSEKCENIASELTSEFNSTASAATASVSASASSAADSATLARSYTKGDTSTRSGESTDNAKYYYERTKELVPEAGAVTGIKGEAESAYRGGNVNLTKENLGISTYTGSTAGLVPDAPQAIVMGQQFLDRHGNWASVQHPHASQLEAGIVKIGNNIDYTNGAISVSKSNVTTALGYTPAESVGIATTSTAGIVKPDGYSITVDDDGTISAPQFAPSKATSTTYGIVKPDNDTITVSDGVISAHDNTDTTTSTSFALATSDGGIRVDSIVGATEKSPNLLKPTLATTTTSNGVTCTPLGSGCFSLSGTASAQTSFTLCSVTVSGSHKLVGCPSGGSDSTYFINVPNTSGVGRDYGNGVIYNFDGTYTVEIVIRANTVCNNLIFKPMLTTDTSATYDDFKPYGLLTSGSFGCVDLGSLTWSYASGQNYFACTEIASVIKPPATDNDIANAYCDNAKMTSRAIFYDLTVNNIIAINSRGYILIRVDGMGTDVNTLKSVIRGHYLAFEVADGKTPSQYAEVVEEHNNAFDGKWTQGNVTIGGAIVDNNVFISSTNFIACKSGDVVKIKVNATVSRIRIAYDGSYTNFTSNEATWTVPSGITQFRFDIGNTWTVANAPSVTVSINGQTTIIPLSAPLRSVGDVKDEIDVENGQIIRRCEMNSAGTDVVAKSTPTYEPLTSAQKIATHSLKAYNGKTYIDSADVYAKPTMTLESAKGEVGAIAIDGQNLGNSALAIAEDNKKSVDNIMGSDAWLSTKSYSANEHFIYQNVLYRVKVACSGITPPNTNYYEVVSLATLNTNFTNKQNVTDNSLATSSKTVVGAINEVNTNLSNKQNVTDNSLATSSKTVVGAINEVDSALSYTGVVLGDNLYLYYTEKFAIIFTTGNASKSTITSATIPQNARPKYSIMASVNARSDDWSNNAGYLQINTNGTLSPSTGSRYNFCITYPL